MHTVVETAEFQKQAKAVWSDAKREAFIANPDAGDVIPGADGARKVRWGRAGKGKRGGVRVILFPPYRRRDCVAGDGLCQGRASQREAQGHQAGLKYEGTEEDRCEQDRPRDRSRCGTCVARSA